MTNEPIVEIPFVQWRSDENLSESAFWSRYGVEPEQGTRYEFSVRAVPPPLLLLIGLHRLGVIDTDDLTHAQRVAQGAQARLGAAARQLRQHEGRTRVAFWSRFGVAKAGGRYERGGPIPAPLSRLLILYRDGRINAASLAEAAGWVEDQGRLAESVPTTSEADARPDDLFAIRWMEFTKRSDGGGYQVRLTRNARHYQRWFGVSRYGSPLGALAAAQRWRDQLIMALPAKTMTEFVAMVRANNNSGIAGVARRECWNRSRTGAKKPASPVWVARSPQCLKASARTFSVSVYGETGARTRAIAARKLMEAQCEGYYTPKLPAKYVRAMTAADKARYAALIQPGPSGRASRRGRPR